MYIIDKLIFHSLILSTHDDTQLFTCSSGSCSPINITLIQGAYKFDLWGASGYNASGSFSRGSHVSGLITVYQPQLFFLYTGEMGSDGGSETFNGGGKGSSIGCFSGGGATDIRLKGGDFSEFSSLLSRIIVAGGGGGHVIHENYPDSYIIHYVDRSNGGALVGGEGIIKRTPSTSNEITSAKGGNQLQGGDRGKIIGTPVHTESGDGKFGIGGLPSSSWSGGGGGHYHHNIIGSGGGGSSFVSGCNGCIAMLPESHQDNMVPLDSSVHYSGFSFKSIEIDSGSDEFLDPSGSKVNGHLGNGVIMITTITYLNIVSCGSIISHMQTYSIFVVSSLFIS